jgi:hypothetical protein
VSRRCQKVAQQKTECIGMIAPVLDERNIRESLGVSCGHRAMIPLEREFPRCKDYQTLFLLPVLKCWAADKSALNLSEPTRDLSLVFAIRLAKVLLQDMLLPWHCVIIEEHKPNYEGNH